MIEPCKCICHSSGLPAFVPSNFPCCQCRNMLKQPQYQSNNVDFDIEFLKKEITNMDESIKKLLDRIWNDYSALLDRIIKLEEKLNNSGTNTILPHKLTCEFIVHKE